MRLFIAVNFNDAVKDRLLDVQSRLRNYALQGRFTDRENLHLTLIFIGEVFGTDIDIVKKAVDTLIGSPFELVLKDIGCFKRDRGDIWWMGVCQSPELTELYHQLVKALSGTEITFDSRPYSPHLTLARDVAFDKSFDKESFSRDISPIHTVVDKISLMKSDRPAGKLIYSEIHSKYLVGECNENK